jgi:hypothetical protein
MKAKPRRAPGSNLEHRMSTVPLAFAALFALAACAGHPAPPSVAPVVPAPVTVDVPAPATPRVDEATYCRILERTADAIGADLTAAAARTDLSPQQARLALARSTPAGARPHIDALLEAEGVTGGQVADFVAANPAVADRCADRFQARMQSFRPALERVRVVARAGEVRKEPFPWREDYETARTEAREKHRPLVLLFCASWTGACSQLDRATFADDALRAVLTERFVAARVDMTDDDDAATKQATARYHIDGLPVIAVFDDKGREQARVTEWIAADKLRAVLEKVAPK